MKQQWAEEKDSIDEIRGINLDYLKEYIYWMVAIILILMVISLIFFGNEATDVLQKLRVYFEANA